jgi:hypothetical protein
MYTDDELEEIRDEDGRGDTGGTDGHTSRRRLLLSVTVSFFGLLLISYLVLGTGSAAVVVSGAGGFYAEFDQINANGAWIYPAVTQTATCQSTVTTLDGRPTDGNTALPVLRVDLADASIPAGDQVRFIKTINTPNILNPNTFSIVVQQGNSPGSTQLDDTTVLVTELEGQNLGLGETIVNESFTRPAGEDPSPKNEVFGPSRPNYFDSTGTNKNLSVLGEFAIKGETGQVTDGSGIAHLVAFESLRLPDVNVSLAYDKYDQYAPDGNSNCPV